MQKIFFLLLFVAQTAVAQVEKGVWLISGSADFTSLKIRVDEEKKVANSQFNFSPKIGYFFTDRLVAGLGISSNSSRKKNVTTDSNGNSETSIIGARVLIISPFARYYFPLSKNLYAWGEVNVGLGSQKTIYDDKVFKLSATQFGVGPGLSIILNENVAIEGMLRFSTTGFEGLVTRSNIGLFGGLQIYF